MPRHAPLIITKTEFLLLLLIIALDPPPQLCDINQTCEGNIFGSSENQYWSAWIPWRTPALSCAARSAWYRDAPAAPSAGQSAKERQSALPPRQVIVRHVSSGQAPRNRFIGDGLVP